MRTKVNKKIIFNKDFWDKKITALVYPVTWLILALTLIVFLVYAL